MSIQEDIAIRVKEQSPGSLLFINDFHEYDNEYVSKLLSLMASYGTLVRLAKGIYYKPIQTEFGVVYPSTERIIKAIAEHEKAEILPTGEYALNALGMSTQVPMKAVYLTSGTPRVITIGKKQIRLKRRSPRMYAYQSKLMPILELALKARGQSNLSNEDLGKVRGILSRSNEQALVYNDLGNAPVWIRKMVKQIFKEINYEPVAKKNN